MTTPKRKPPRGKFNDSQRLTWLLDRVAHAFSFDRNPTGTTGWETYRFRRDIDRAMRAGKGGGK